jgi:hypothetical protein
MIKITGLWLFFSFTQVFAQKIVATVNFDLQYLQQEAKDVVLELKPKLEDYINSYDYAEDELGLVIPIKVNVIFESYSISGGNTEFKAQLLISSPAGENFYDKNWKFPYRQGEIIIHDEASPHPITSLIDYYIYLVLGGEMDTYQLLGGTDFYEIARNILARARTLGSEWSLRDRDFQELIDGRLLPLREAKYYYYQSLFLIEIAEAADIQKIREYNSEFVKKLKEAFEQSPNAKPIKRFFDYHFDEICTLLQYEATSDLLNEIIAMDPIHKNTYQKCLEEFF